MNTSEFQRKTYGFHRKPLKYLGTAMNEIRGKIYDFHGEPSKCIGTSLKYMGKPLESIDPVVKSIGKHMNPLGNLRNTNENPWNSKKEFTKNSKVHRQCANSVKKGRSVYSL